MSTVADTTAAVMVVYQLTAPVDAVLARLVASVGRVIVVDNHESGHPGLADTARGCGATYHHGGNAGGLAGAYNTALQLLGQDRAPRQVVFLDQDSDPSVLPAFLADPRTIECLKDADTAAVAPAYRDRATGLRGRYIALRHWSLSHLPREFQGLRTVAFVINSMSVWRWDALQRIGAFDEGLAIDHVDTEYCLRARRAGLRVIVHGDHEFLHAIGQRRRYRILGRELQAGGHAPARRYLIGRNTAALARQWWWREPAFAFLCLTRIAYEMVGILMVEDDAAAKVSALLNGVLRGVFGPRPR